MQNEPYLNLMFFFICCSYLLAIFYYSSFTLIESCWEYKSQDRPTFAEIVMKLEQYSKLKADLSVLDDNRLTEDKN